jgi:hypothetical protein
VTKRLEREIDLAVEDDFPAAIVAPVVRAKVRTVAAKAAARTLDYVLGELQANHRSTGEIRRIIAKARFERGKPQ